MKQHLFEKIYDVTRKIPFGRVSTYGKIGDYVECSPREVGWALNNCHNLGDVPAHRVVNRKGELSGRLHFATPTLMQQLLEQESVEIEDNTVKDFKKHLWEPLSEL